MSDAATIQELQAACPNAGSSFYVEQMKQEASIEQALRAHTEDLNKEIERLKKLIPVDPKQHSLSGNDALNDLPDSNTSRSGSAIEEFNEQVEGHVKRGMSRSAAASFVNRENPGLREQMVAEANA